MEQLKDTPNHTFTWHYYTTNFCYQDLVGNIYMQNPSGQSGLSDHCYKFWMYPLPSTKFSILVSHICESSLPPAIFHVDILLLILEICNIFPEKFLHLHHTWFGYLYSWQLSLILASCSSSLFFWASFKVIGPATGRPGGGFTVTTSQSSIQACLIFNRRSRTTSRQLNWIGASCSLWLWFPHSTLLAPFVFPLPLALPELFRGHAPDRWPVDPQMLHILGWSQLADRWPVLPQL